jgi:DNA invertase Pin-like site-specific DNA recombinase
MLSLNKQATRRAVAYYRHSAEEKQENSVLIQREKVEKFAQEHGVEIIHYEADEGVSGLTSNRPAFNRLFTKWIENPDAPQFEYVFVLDVSRWGR